MYISIYLSYLVVTSTWACPWRRHWWWEPRWDTRGHPVPIWRMQWRWDIDIPDDADLGTLDVALDLHSTGIFSYRTTETNHKQKKTPLFTWFFHFILILIDACGDSGKPSRSKYIMQDVLPWLVSRVPGRNQEVLWFHCRWHFRHLDRYFSRRRCILRRVWLGCFQRRPSWFSHPAKNADFRILSQSYGHFKCGFFFIKKRCGLLFWTLFYVFFFAPQLLIYTFDY